MHRQRSRLATIPKWTRGWTRYHISVVAFFATIAFGALLRGVMVINSGGWEVDTSIDLPYAPAQLWPIVSAADQRVNWHAGVSDLIPLKKADGGEKGSTYSIWYLRHPVTWRGKETVLQYVPGRLLVTYIDSELDERNFSVELKPQGNCLTRVRLTETVSPKNYWQRYRAIYNAFEEADRAERSLSQLKRRAERQLQKCSG